MDTATCREPAISRNGCSSAGRDPAKSTPHASDPIPTTQDRSPSRSRNPTERTMPAESASRSRTSATSIAARGGRGPDLHGSLAKPFPILLNRRVLARCAIVTATSSAFVQPEDNRVSGAWLSGRAAGSPGFRRLHSLMAPRSLHKDSTGSDFPVRAAHTVRGTSGLTASGETTDKSGGRRWG